MVQDSNSTKHCIEYGAKMLKIARICLACGKTPSVNIHFITFCCGFLFRHNSYKFFDFLPPQLLKNIYKY